MLRRFGRNARLPAAAHADAIVRGDRAALREGDLPRRPRRRLAAVVAPVTGAADTRAWASPCSLRPRVLLAVAAGATTGLLRPDSALDAGVTLGVVAAAGRRARDARRAAPPGLLHAGARARGSRPRGRSAGGRRACARLALRARRAPRLAARRRCAASRGRARSSRSRRSRSPGSCSSRSCCRRSPTTR